MYDPGILDLIDSGEWRLLTDNPRKLDLYGTEPLFRRAWATLEGLGEERLVPALQDLAMLVLLPDALAARRAEPCLDYLSAHHFTPLLVHRFRFDRESFSDMWRYQINAATLDSLMLDELVCCKTDSVALVLRDVTPDTATTGAARLAALKGTSDPRRRTTGHLRTVLGCLNHVFVMVHCADDPLDIVRELAITTKTDRELADCLRRSLAVPEAGDTADRKVELLAVQDSVPAHEVDPDAALIRVRTEIENRARKLPHPGERALRTLDSALVRRELDWRAWSTDLALLGIDPTSWDVLLVATHHTRHDLPGAVQLIESGRHRGVDTTPR